MAGRESSSGAEVASDLDLDRGEVADVDGDLNDAPQREGELGASAVQFIDIFPRWFIEAGKTSHVSVLMREYEYTPEAIALINKTNKYKKRGARLVIAPQSIKEMVDGIIAAAGNTTIKGLAINSHGGSGYIHSGPDKVVLGHSNASTWVSEIARLSKVLKQGSCVYLSGCGTGMGFDGLQFGKKFAEALPGVRIHAGVNLNSTFVTHEDSPFSAAEMYEGSYHVFSSDGGKLTVEDHYKRDDREHYYWGPMLDRPDRSRASRLGLLLLDAAGLDASVAAEKASIASNGELSKGERRSAKVEARTAGATSARNLGDALLALLKEYEGETNQAMLAVDLADVYSTRDIEAIADVVFNGATDDQYMQYGAVTATILRDVPALQRAYAAGKIRGAGKALQQYLAQQKITVKNTPLRN